MDEWIELKREELYKKIWKTPMSRLASEYELSDVGLKKICKKLNIDPDKRMNDLTSDEINQIRGVIDNDFTVEGRLRTQTALNIKRLMDIGCYRGLRHRKGLPLRGQRTKTNSRTRKGKKKTVAGKKK